MSSRPPPNESDAGDSGSRVRIEPIARNPAPGGPAREAAPGRPEPQVPQHRVSRQHVFIAGGLALLAGVLVLPFLGGDSPPPTPPLENAATSTGAANDSLAGAALVPAAEPPAPRPSAGPADRNEAARLLGEFQALVESLAPHAERWAGERYHAALALLREGENALIADDAARAMPALRAGIALLREIDTETPQALAGALGAGSKALEDGDGPAARGHFELALAIAPEEERAQRGLQRVESLDGVLAEMATGAEREERRDWSGARDAYAKALELDRDWQPASAGLARVDAHLVDEKFEMRLAKGLQALAAGRLGEARKSLRAALALHPSSREAKDALEQVEEEARLVSIGRAQRDARIAEAREDWVEALRSYEAALALDGDLRFAQEGLTRSRERAALDKRLRFLLEDPTRLYAAAALREAEGLAAAIETVPDPGPRLREQKARLRERVVLASTPISIEFSSDKLTDVTIVQVQRLGAFDRLAFPLRPGTYVVTGSRRGYRDVRKSLTVTPGEPAPTVVVRCTETI